MRLVLAEDHALFRAGIASLLQAWGHEVVGEAGNGLEALEGSARISVYLTGSSDGVGTIAA